MLRCLDAVAVPAVNDFIVSHMYREATMVDGVPFAYIDPRFYKRLSSLTESSVPEGMLGVHEIMEGKLAKDLYQGEQCLVHPAHFFAFLKKADKGGAYSTERPQADEFGPRQFGPSHFAFLRDEEGEPLLVDFSLISGGAALYWCIHVLDFYEPVWAQKARPAELKTTWHVGNTERRGWGALLAEPSAPTQWEHCASGHPREPYPRLPQGRRIVLQLP